MTETALDAIRKCAANPALYWPWTEIEGRMQAMTDRFPELARMEVFGQACDARPLAGIRIGNQDRCIALIGAVHAVESGPEIIIPVLEKFLGNDGDLLDKVGIAALPSLNFAARQKLSEGTTGNYRCNLNGVDLNRNFPCDWEIVAEEYGMRSDDPSSHTYCGPAPASEPETQAAMHFISTVKPAALFAFHFINSVAGACFHGAQSAKDDAGYVGRCLGLVRPYTAAFYDDSAGRAAKRLFVNYPDFGGSLYYYMFAGGTLCTWVYRTFGIPAFDVEEGSDLPAEQAAKESTLTIEHLADCQQRHYRGLRSVLREMGKNGEV